MTNDYYGTLSYVGNSPLPNGTGGTNTWQITIDPVTWAKSLAPTLKADGAALGTNTGVTVLFDQDTGELGPQNNSATWSASAVYTVNPGVTLGLTITGLPDASDLPFFGAPAMVGSSPPGPPFGPPLAVSCAWDAANYPSPGSSQGPGNPPGNPGTSPCGTYISVPTPYTGTSMGQGGTGFATVAGGGPLAGTALTGFSENTIFITGASQPEADAVWTAVKWKMQEMPQTDTDADGVPDPPAGYFSGANNGYPVKGYFDNCPFAANPTQKDSVGNLIGDACRCGDVNNDGLINVSDKTILGRSLPALSPYFGVGAMPGFNKCVVSSGGACNTAAKTIIGRALANLSPGIGEYCHSATTFP